MRVYAISLISLLIGIHSVGQTLNISGKITDTDGKPIEKVSVLVKNRSVGTQSDAGGNWMLAGVSHSDTLVASAIGFTSLQIVLNGRSYLLIRLEKDHVGLEEVIVNTGYQDIPQERATGSFTKIDEKQLNLQAGTSILSRLDGLTSSLLIDPVPGHPALTVRGLSTINGPAAPLIVLDNFPYEGSLDLINPNDVESVTLLKDAAAASIWGARAGNGVIVITTKKGKLRQRMKVDVKADLILAKKPDLSVLPGINAKDFIEVEEFLYSQGYYNSQLTQSSRPLLSPVIELLIQKDEGAITEQTYADAIRGYQSNDFRSEYQRLLYRSAVTQQYSVTASGGTDKSTYLISSGYYRSIGQLSQQSERATLRLQQQYRPIAGLQIEGALALTHSTNKSGAPGYTSIRVAGKNVYPYARLTDENGEPAPLYQYRQPYIDTAGGGKLLDWKYYPLTDHLHGISTGRSNQLIGNLAVNYELFRGMTANLRYQLEAAASETQRLEDIDSYTTRNRINQYSQINPITGVVSYIVPYGATLRTSPSNTVAQNAKAQLNYSRQFNDHQITAIAGAEIREIKYNASSSLLYGYDPELGITSSVDFVNRYPHFITKSNTYIPDGSSVSGNLNRYTALFSNASYLYKQRYLLSASARKDASNLFGVKTNEKGVPLWSAGAGWILSKEDFFNSSVFRMLKLRATYGFSGNIDNSRTAVTTIGYVGTASYTNFPFAAVMQPGNPSLRWERVKTINFGIDFALRSGWLDGSIEYYQKKGLDLFGPSEIDYTTGVGNTLIKNVAHMAGHGVDIELHTRPVNREFKWQQSFVFNLTRNKITDYFQTTTLASAFISHGKSLSPLIGTPVYALISYQWAGLDETGAPQGVVNGKPSTNYTEITGPDTQIEDLVYSGSATPTIFGNFLNTIEWKGFSLSANITYKCGYYFQRSSVSYTTLYNSWTGHNDFTRRWQQPGDEKHTDVPAMTYPARGESFHNSSAALVTNAAHFRLQFIRFGYSPIAPKNTAGLLNRFEFFANLANLGIIWRSNPYAIDPDYPDALPRSLQFALGIKASF